MLKFITIFSLNVTIFPLSSVKRKMAVLDVCILSIICLTVTSPYTQKMTGRMKFLNFLQKMFTFSYLLPKLKSSIPTSKKHANKRYVGLKLINKNTTNSNRKITNKRILKIMVMRRAIFLSQNADATLTKILPPSSGYAGRRLNSASTTLTLTKFSVKKYVCGNIHHTPTNKNADTRLANGPASAILISSRKSKLLSKYESENPYGESENFDSLYPNFLATRKCPSS